MDVTFSVSSSRHEPAEQLLDSPASFQERLTCITVFYAVCVCVCVLVSLLSSDCGVQTTLTGSRLTDEEQSASFYLLSRIKMHFQLLKLPSGES